MENLYKTTNNHIPEEKRFDSERAFEVFFRRIGRFDDYRAPIGRRLLRIAAVIAVVAGVSTATYYYGTQQEEEEISTSTSVAIPEGAEGSVTLPDGTKVSLKGGSEISYASDYGKESRKVDLSGEGMFTVKHDSLCPFSVKAGNLRVNDIGTTFTVTAYKADSIQQVELISGSASVENSAKKDLALTLKPGQTAVFNTSTGQLSIKRSADTGHQRMGNGTITFEGMEMQQIAKLMEREYGYHIVIKSSRLAQTRYYGAFNKKENSIDAILKMLQQAKYFKYKIQDHTVTLSL